MLSFYAPTCDKTYGWLGMPLDLNAAPPRVHEYVYPGLYSSRPPPGSKTRTHSAAAVPGTTAIKPRVNVPVNPG